MIYRRTMLFGFNLLLFSLLIVTANAGTSTDGNYTLLQYDFTGSGVDSTDTNYHAFFDAGEPVTGGKATDANYASGTGFFGEPLLVVIAAVVEAVAAVVSETAYIILNASQTNARFMVLVGGVVLIALFFAFLMHRRGQEEDELGGWYYE